MTVMPVRTTAVTVTLNVADFPPYLTVIVLEPAVVSDVGVQV